MKSKDHAWPANANASSREPIAIIGIGCRYAAAPSAAEFWEQIASDRPAVSITAAGSALGFDAAFFGMSREEATRLDEQQRWLLEVSADALDDAFVSNEQLTRQVVGVYVSATTTREGHDQLERQGLPSTCVSRAFDLRGPSMTVDTAGCASLIAPHLACQSLWLGETSLAIAAGVELGSDLGPSCGVVVLMTLSNALAHNARVYALIRGTGASHDGIAGSGPGTPSEAGLALAIRAAFRCASLSPDDVAYVDTAHDAAVGGITGLIEVTVALHLQIVPKKVRPGAPRAFASAHRTHPPPVDVARAGVSSLGSGGTHVHAILEELVVAPQASRELTPERAELLVLSAMSTTALRASARAYAELLARPVSETGSLREVAYSASLGRQHHRLRLAAVGQTRGAMLEALVAYEHGEPHPCFAANSCTSALLAPVFVFSGQGSQWYGMGRSLLDDEPTFRIAIHACDSALRRHSSWSLWHELTREPRDQRPIRVIQPLIFAVQVALAALWRSWGVHPGLVVGHSMGEVAAAHVAGILTLDDAALIICRRSENLQEVAERGTQLDRLLPQFRRALAGVRPRADAEIPIHSTVTGDRLEPAAFDVEYWVRNQREPLRYVEAIQRAIRQGYSQFIEIAPHPILLGSIQQLLRDEKTVGVTLGSMRRDVPERAQLLRSVGQLHTLGHAINFAALFRERSRFVTLPRYAWQRESLSAPAELSDAGSRVC